MKKWLSYLGIFFYSLPACAQTSEEWLNKEKVRYELSVRESQKEREKLQQEYDGSIKRRDQEFAGFLKERWIEYRIFQGKVPPAVPRPKEAPVTKTMFPQKYTRRTVLPPKTLAADHPAFPSHCPTVYKSLGNIDFIREENGMVQLKTHNGQTVHFDQIGIRDESRIRIFPLPGKYLKIEIVEEVDIGKTDRRFHLNRVILKRKSGDMVLDYGRDHTLLTRNIIKDFLN